MRALRNFSLEQKLALLITGVMALVVAGSLALTYGFLTRSSEEEASDRLASAAHELARNILGVSTDRAIRVEGIAESDPVIRAVRALDTTGMQRGRRTDRRIDSASALAGARQALTTLYGRKANADAPPVELWDTAGRRLTFIGRDIPIDTVGANGRALRPDMHPVRRAGMDMPRNDSTRFGRLYAEMRHVFYWVVAPVRAPVGTNGDTITIGYVAQQLRFASPPDATTSLRGLSGEDITMMMRNADGDVWAAAPGVVTEPRVVKSRVRNGFIAAGASGDVILAESPVVGSPWLSVIEAPLAGIHKRTNELLETIATFGILLILGGALLSLVLGRRVARPLASLTYAAEAIAHGDYARRVPFSGGDEIGRLAVSFNQMAAEVDASRTQLQQQFDEARESAHQLESSNEQLQAAMRDAERLREEAQHANRAKSDFLAVMSHELRTPLNAIGGYAQLLDIGVHGPVTDAQRDALARIARSQAHLLRLINDVLNFARIDAGQVRYTMSHVPLDETLTGLEALIAPQLRAKRLQFTYRAAGGDATVYADTDKLQQIVINLLTNAIKFTPEGGAITVESEQSAASVRIRVRDNGVGIPAERLSAIFDPFVQVDRNAHQPSDGVGLGLAISRDLARGMAGDLVVESVVGEGSTFILILPTQVQNRVLRTDPRGSVALAG